MSLAWMPREHGKKDHDRHSKEHWGTEPPCVVYEKKPLKDLKGNVTPGLFNAWIRLNNPAQYNSYTTEMVKGVIAGFENASTDRSVVAAVFTGTGPFAFCTGGNTKEYSEYYSMRPEEYGNYMEKRIYLFEELLTVVKAGSEQTGGAFNLFDAVCPPGFATPFHIHYAEDVAVFVLEGTLTFFSGSEKKAAGVGSYFSQPRGTPHGFRLEGDSPARILYMTIPAGFDQFILEHKLTSQKTEIEEDAARYKIEILGPLPK